MRRLKVSILISVLVLATITGACMRSFIPPPGEVEATEFNGVKLTPISQQGNNGLAGTDQHIDKETYRLVIDGLVERPLSISYDDLMKYPAESRLAPLNCVEGWNFNAKWTGPRLAAILDDAVVKP